MKFIYKHVGFMIFIGVCGWLFVWLFVHPIIKTLENEKYEREQKTLENKTAKEANLQVRKNIAENDLLSPLPDGFKHKMIVFPTHGGRGKTHDPGCLCIKLRDAKLDFIIQRLKARE